MGIRIPGGKLSAVAIGTVAIAGLGALNPAIGAVARIVGIVVVNVSVFDIVTKTVCHLWNNEDVYIGKSDSEESDELEKSPMVGADVSELEEESMTHEEKMQQLADQRLMNDRNHTNRMNKLNSDHAVRMDKLKEYEEKLDLLRNNIDGYREKCLQDGVPPDIDKMMGLMNEYNNYVKSFTTSYITPQIQKSRYMEEKK